MSIYLLVNVCYLIIQLRLQLSCKYPFTTSIQNSKQKIKMYKIFISKL